jgi:signal transduction histidine kinase
MAGNHSRLAVVGLTTLLIVTVGLVDYLTGEEISVSIFYLIPVYLCTWQNGRRCGLLAALAAATVWLAADLAIGRRQGHPLIPYWNAAVLLGFFWIVVWLLSALRASYATLEEKVKQRTGDLQSALSDLRQSHADLQATQLQLIEAAKLETVGRLAAGVAHEVKNPLMTLTMVADYFDQTSVSGNPDDASMRQDMHDAIRRANRVISELLEFSRPGALKLATEDLPAIVASALSLVKLEIKRRHVEVVCENAPSLPAVTVDKNKIEQVLVNVFMNAIQAMSEGGTLTVRTLVTPATGGHGSGLTLEVDDTGPGISEANLRKLFEPFFTTKPAGEGTGLGLSVARRIVQLHGGTLSLGNWPAPRNLIQPS